MDLAVGFYDSGVDQAEEERLDELRKEKEKAAKKK
jgi:hypothetical protein